MYFFSEKAGTEDFVWSAIDAECFETNEFFKSGPHEARPHIWSDGLKFVNPMGYKTKQNASIVSFAFCYK
jgi:hypothetical protein